MCVHVCAHACPQLCLTFCDCVDYSQAPLSTRFFRQEYWSKLPFPTTEDLPNPEIEPASLIFPALTGVFFTIEPPGKPQP